MNIWEKYKNIIIMILLFFLYYIYPLLQLGYAKLIGIDFIYENEQLILNISDKLRVFLKLLADSTFAIFLFFVYRKSIKEDFKKFIKNFGNITNIAIKYWLIGLAIMATSNILINKFTSLGSSTNQQAVNNIISSAPIMAFIITTFIAPFVEEIIFRKTFKDAIKSKIPFILTSGIFFGTIHILSSITTSLFGLLYIIPYAALGICLSIIYYKTDNIFSTIFIHMIHNGALVLLYIFTTTVL